MGVTETAGDWVSKMLNPVERDMILIVMAGLLVGAGAGALFGGGAGMIPDIGRFVAADADWDEASVISEDPELQSFSAIRSVAPSNYTGYIRSLDVYFEPGRYGPWYATEGYAYMPGEILVGRDTDGFFLFPGPVPETRADALKTGHITQTVTLPEDNFVRMVARVENGVEYLKPNHDPDVCRDSKIILVATAEDGRTKNTDIVVRQTMKTVTLDISEYAGQTVNVTLMNDMVDTGCGLKIADFALIDSFYVEATPR